MSKSIHRMELPREVVVGSNLISEIPEVCRRLGFSMRALVLSGPTTYKMVGEDVANSLAEHMDADCVVVAPAPTEESVEEVQEKIRRFKPQVVLGVGGGRLIDVAKLSSAREGIPFISVPTAASHDGISSPVVSLKTAKKEALSVMAHPPIAIIADTSIIVKSPYRLTASGCGDIIAKYTAVRDWKLAHKLKNEYYGEYAANLALMGAKLITQNAEDIRRNTEEGLRVVLEALISCGVAMGIAGSSRPGSGSEHMFSHALDMVAPNPALHGEQCGVGTIMMAYLHGAKWRMIRDTLKTIGAPINAEELGIEPKYIIEALTIAHKVRPDRYTILGENGLSREAAEKLAKKTGVID